MSVHKYQPARNPAWRGKCGYRGLDGAYCRKLRDDPAHGGGIMRITCPFGPHVGVVRVLGVGANALIENHSLDLAGERTLGCPASLMHWPLGDTEKSALAQQAKDLLQQFRRDITDDAERSDPSEPQNYAATPQGLLHIYCGTKHMPGTSCPGPKSRPIGGRGERNPDPKSDLWALGGRVDEEIIPADQVVTGKVPPDAYGESIGRGSVSATDHAQAARKAMQATDEAAQAVMQAKAKIGEARSIVAELLGDGNGQTLTTWLSGLNEIADSLDKVGLASDVANATGEIFIQNVMS